MFIWLSIVVCFFSHDIVLRIIRLSLFALFYWLLYYYIGSHCTYILNISNVAFILVYIVMNDIVYEGAMVSGFYTFLYYGFLFCLVSCWLPVLFVWLNCIYVLYFVNFCIFWYILNYFRIMYCILPCIIRCILYRYAYNFNFKLFLGNEGSRKVRPVICK